MDNKIVYINNMRTVTNSYKVTGHPINLFKLRDKIESKNKITYHYITPKNDYKKPVSNLYLIVNKYSLEEIQLIDELFSNLDADNLRLIKAIIHSKYKKDGKLSD